MPVKKAKTKITTKKAQASEVKKPTVDELMGDTEEKVITPEGEKVIIEVKKEESKQEPRESADDRDEKRPNFQENRRDENRHGSNRRYSDFASK
jgi:hypothetical protein